MEEQKKLLVVDDESDVCDFVKSFFEERNYTVFTALNGNEAISIFQKEKPGLILLDVKMKSMDGLTVLRQLKAMDENVKVIMVTALDEQDKIDAARQFGAVGYITKPLVLGNLEETVERYLR
ncbi:MAG: response regulator [Candidatus Omnitrophota bacterium]